MRKILLTLAAIASVALSSSAVVININSTNFPDGNFRAYVTSLTPGGNGKTIETDGVTDINVNGKMISELTGIEHFTELQTLSADNIPLTFLDLSKNTKLTSVSVNKSGTTENTASSPQRSRFYNVSFYRTEDKDTTFIYLSEISKNLDPAKVNLISGGGKKVTLNTLPAIIRDITTAPTSTDTNGTYRTSYITYSYDSGNPAVGDNGLFYFQAALKTYDTALTTAIDDVDAASVKAFANGGCIYVEGTHGVINVFNMAGAQVYSGTDSVIPAANGMYLVRAEGKVFKVIVR